MLTIRFFLIFLIAFSMQAQSASFNNATVKELNIDQYLGTWYEIARYDHKFERNLVGVRAEYSLRDDGKIKVVNSGYKEHLKGEYSQSIGKAKRPNPEEPGKLKVSFFLFFYGDYLVMERDKNYKWAIVGSSSNKYLWILSREPFMDDELYKQLLKKISDRGYPTKALIKVEQDPDYLLKFPSL